MTGEPRSERPRPGGGSDRARREVDAILTRRAEPAQGRWVALTVSVVLHAALVAATLFVPELVAAREERIEFTPVTIVPVQALGDPTPRPAPETPAPRPEPEPEPEPEEEPAPEPEEPAEEPPPRPSPGPSRQPVERAPEPRPEPQPSPPRQRQGSAFGSATGTSPFGATASVGIVNPNFTYDYYVDQMLARIGANWVRPRVFQGVEAVVRFRVERDGTVRDVELVRESENRAFDQAALRAVRLASPLPPLPASFPDEALTVNLVVR